jgi:hypothetical protein
MDINDNDFVYTLNLMLFREKCSDAGSEVETDRERLADVIALTSVFMGDAGASAAKDKLMGYYSALRDLSQGITHPIFKASVRMGKPPPSSEMWRSRATVAIALDCLLKSKISFDDAFKKIKKMPNIKRIVSGGGNLKKSVKNWRDTLNDGSVENHIALERWRAAQQALAKFTAPDDISLNMLFHEEAERLLKVAAREIALIVLPGDAALPRLRKKSV